MRSVCLCICFLLLNTLLYAQESTDQQLAQYYFSRADFQKALPYCKNVFQKENTSFTFGRYYQCLLKTQNDKEAEKLIKKQIDREPTNIVYLSLLGDYYETHDQQKAATKLYAKLIDEFSTSSTQLVELYQSFKSRGKTELMFEVLQEGRKKLKTSYPLHLLFADYYASQRLYEKMIAEYLDLLEIDLSYKEQVQTSLASNIDFTKTENPFYDLLQEALIERAQSRNSEVVYSELLIWLFTQKKQYTMALNQAQAMDKREKGNGLRVYELSSVFMQNKAYELARKGFKYVMQYELNSPYYMVAEEALLHCRFLEITDAKKFTLASLDTVFQEYDNAINRIGKNRNAINLIKEKAYIQAFYGQQLEPAIQLLQESLKFFGLNATQLAEIKMQLADIYVLKDDIWEASILYMQIDKEFKFETIGFEAKFKNARIFYYDGDFKFAQSQLDILKQSTSKLIANDALKLSLLITDNYGLDSNYVAMKQFAQADLLLEQHKYDQAFQQYDSIVKAYPFHGLNDEILLRKSIAFQQQGKWQNAVVLLEELLTNYGDDILADDALFQLANIYENHLSEKEKAIECYKKILFTYKGSLYGVEARKRLRLLRGDKFIEEETLEN